MDRRFEETKLSSPHTPREHLVSPQVSAPAPSNGHPFGPQTYPVAYDRTAIENQAGPSAHAGSSSAGWIPDASGACLTADVVLMAVDASSATDGHLHSMSALSNTAMVSAYTPYGQIPRDPQTEPYTGHSRLEDCMGRDTAIYVLSLFFDYVSLSVSGLAKSRSILSSLAYINPPLWPKSRLALKSVPTSFIPS